MNPIHKLIRQFWLRIAGIGFNLHQYASQKEYWAHKRIK